MEQVKIGKFIAERRKSVNLTQIQLAEKLGITDRAVSKWETGKSMPDSSIMLDLCAILKITVIDLLTGEVVSVENYNKELENNLVEMVKQKQEGDKRLLRTEIVMGICCIIPFIIATVCVLAIPMEEWLGVVIILGSLLPLLIATPFALLIEQKAGYYECENCGNKTVPKYSKVFFAPHVNRTRLMNCDKCGKITWQKKRLTKED
ncbi:MAG: helix-turn-helix transcriptional regulator [Clostridia bacterium]|nr:helix-turn-helix transcriptional regulator [Clostridia bacterium]